MTLVSNFPFSLSSFFVRLGWTPLLALTGQGSDTIHPSWDFPARYEGSVCEWPDLSAPCRCLHPFVLYFMSGPPNCNCARCYTSFRTAPSLHGCGLSCNIPSVITLSLPASARSHLRSARSRASSAHVLRSQCLTDEDRVLEHSK